MNYKDYYQILGVPRNASLTEIKRGYRQQARRYHPDVSHEANAEQRFKDVQEAYAVLKDATKRSAYDQLGAHWQAGQAFHPPPNEQARDERVKFSSDDIDQFSDFFASLFGRGFRRPRKKNTTTKKQRVDNRKQVVISLEEAMRGVTKRIELTAEPSSRRPASSRVFDVHIPAGVTNGQQIRLTGQGKRKQEGADQDLLLQIKIAPHSAYRVEGRHLHLTIPVTPWEAAFGTTLTLKTPRGSINLKIPAATQSNTKLRLKHQGLGQGDQVGDLFIRLEIVNPPLQSSEQQALYHHLATLFPNFDPRAHLNFK
jgi:curved DNA-binding protein